jgi:hypothetical protein
MKDATSGFAAILPATIENSVALAGKLSLGCYLGRVLQMRPNLQVYPLAKPSWAFFAGLAWLTFYLFVPS